MENGIILNVTTKVDWSIHEAWLQWMLDVHIPEILGTGCFDKHRVLRLTDIDEEEGPTYAIQYEAAGMRHYQQYINFYAARLTEQAFAKWGNKFMSFRSLMHIIQ